MIRLELNREQEGVVQSALVQYGLREQRAAERVAEYPAWEAAKLHRRDVAMDVALQIRRQHQEVDHD